MSNTETYLIWLDVLREKGLIEDGSLCVVTKGVPRVFQALQT